MKGGFFMRLGIDKRDSHSFLRTITFDEFCNLVCWRIPEADPDKVRAYLKVHSRCPYDFYSVMKFIREIENMMIDEGSI